MHGRGAAHRAAPWRECGSGCPRGENRRADSCRSRSCPAAAVDLRADPLPVRVLELLAEAAFPVSDERRRLLQTAALPAGQHHPQSSLGQGPKRGLLLARETLHALEEVVGYLVCRLLLEKKKLSERRSGLRYDRQSRGTKGVTAFCLGAFEYVLCVRCNTSCS